MRHIVGLYLSSEEQILLVLDRDLLIRVAIVELVLIVGNLPFDLGHLIILVVHFGAAIVNVVICDQNLIILTFLVGCLNLLHYLVELYLVFFLLELEPCELLFEFLVDSYLSLFALLDLLSGSESHLHFRFAAGFSFFGSTFSLLLVLESLEL